MMASVVFVTYVSNGALLHRVQPFHRSNRWDCKLTVVDTLELER